MSILIMTIPVSMLLVTFFILAFLAAVKNDQFDDLETPAHAMLIDDFKTNNNTTEEKNEADKGYKG